jgi:hypothetical protein
MIARLKCLFMKGWPVTVDPVTVLDDKEKLRENPRSLPVNGLMGQESKWTDRKLEKYAERNAIQVPGMDKGGPAASVPAAEVPAVRN